MRKCRKSSSPVSLHLHQRSTTWLEVVVGEQENRSFQPIASRCRRPSGLGRVTLFPNPFITSQKSRGNHANRRSSYPQTGRKLCSGGSEAPCCNEQRPSAGRNSQLQPDVSGASCCSLWSGQPWAGDLLWTPRYLQVHGVGTHKPDTVAPLRDKLDFTKSGGDLQRMQRSSTPLSDGFEVIKAEPSERNTRPG
jgi:hypothetical protein